MFSSSLRKDYHSEADPLYETLNPYPFQQFNNSSSSRKVSDPILHTGVSDSDSGRLQKWFQYMEDTFQNHITDTSSKPSSSKAPILSQVSPKR
ncbi:hypothetical protein Bca4012_025123 [Brassica carinata]